ncbi:PAS domain S-box protein [Mariprofundus erugo]|nr:PAS domain S-box protein [Mariprofundus erugo]
MMANQNRRGLTFSLRGHIAAATAAISIILSLGISFMAASISKTQIEHREGRAFAKQAHHTAEMLDRAMFERYREMQVASVLSDISSAAVPPDAKRKVLERMQSSFNAYAWIGICDANGIGLVGTGKYLEGKDLSKRPWCTQGRDKPYVGDIHDALLLAKILPNPSGEKFYLLDVAAPVREPGGKLLGVLCGHIYWKWAEEMLNVSDNPDTNTLLTSKDGLLLAGPLPARSQLADAAPQTMAAARKQQTGFRLEKWSDGKTYLTGFSQGNGYRDYPGLGWISLYRQNVDIAFAPARDLQNRILLLGLSLGLLFSVIGWFQAGRIARPIQAITHAAKRVAAGNLDYTAPPIEADAEVEELADSIQQMTSTLSREISDRRQAEERLRKISEAVHQAGEAVIITNRQGVIEYINPACSDITGYSLEELVGQTPAILKSNQQNPEFYATLWQTITGGEVWHGTLIDKRKDGILYPAMMSVAPIRDEHGEITHFVSIQQDMSDQKRLEEQFIQSQKMEALGTLVGGIAHDFNNMLAGINGNIFLAKKAVLKPDKITDRLEQIEALTTRASEMIRQMMAFARKDTTKKRELDLGEQMRTIIRLAKTAIPESTRLTLALDETELPVLGDATQLHQIILNLVNNAQHALSGRDQPQITIGLQQFEASKAFMTLHPELTTPHLAHIYVSDNGQGISEAILSRVTEPFFTTKEAGKGTGLGLAMVFGAIQSHRGKLVIESAEGVGTTIHIYLPLHTTDRPAQDAHEVQTSIVAANGECILLVDDDELLRNVLREGLESLGYRVTTAVNGRQAMQIYSEQSADIDLVLIDVVMPEMGGVEAAKQIIRINPQVRLVFMTGYDREQFANDRALLEQYEAIMKPVQIEALSVALSRALRQG